MDNKTSVMKKTTRIITIGEQAGNIWTRCALNTHDKSWVIFIIRVTFLCTQGSCGIHANVN